MVGLKPTHGRVPVTGHWPPSLLRFMHAGPLARSVRDVALALGVLAGPDGEDWHAVPVPGAGGARPGGRRARPARGVHERRARSRGARGRRRRARRRRGAGRRRAPWSTARSWAPPDCNLLTLTVYGCESSAFFAGVTAGREDDLHPFLRARLGRPLPPLQAYVEAEAEVERVRASFTAFLADHDVLVCHTTGLPPHEHDLEAMVLDGESHHPRSVMRATIPFDLTGSPAISVPFGHTPDGLPIGVQVVGRRFDEATVLRVALALERARGPWRAPSLDWAATAP